VDAEYRFYAVDATGRVVDIVSNAHGRRRFHRHRSPPEFKAVDGSPDLH
jgi:hypothetical protein